MREPIYVLFNSPPIRKRVRNIRCKQESDWQRIKLGLWEPPPPPPVFDLYSWGINDQGQLGLGDNTLRTSPVQIGASKWKKICAGNYHTLGIKEDGTLWAWGSNSYYALGTTWGDKISPVQIGTDKWKDISAGSLFSLGIREDGTLWAWGYNNYGQLGLGHTSTRTIPTQVGTDNDWKKVEGYNVSSAALKENGTLWTCGYNANGELGLGDTTNRTSFTQVGTDTWIMISPGNTSQHMGGIKSDGTLWMWGHGWGWKIGNNSTSNRLSPIKITTDKWICIAVDGTCTLGIKENGTLWGWGTNYLNTIGQGAIGAYIRIPVQIGYATNWKLVKTGLHTLAIKTDGTLWSWGANDYGQVGQGNQNTQNNMAQVGFDTTWKDIACGYYHSIGSKD